MSLDPPSPPDPRKTAEAQTGTNVTTALANARLNMTDRVGPNGSTTFQEIGTQTVTDPSTGATYSVPRYKETTRLTPTGRMANDSNQRTQAILARTGTDVARNLEGHLGQEFTLDGLPQGGRASDIAAAGAGLDMGGNLRRGVNIDTGRVNAGGVDTRAVNAGDLAMSYGDPEGYATQRQRVEDALMTRINPSLDRDREALRTSLINQGVGEGTEAFDRAMNRFGEQSNDARMSAILGAGQEQTRLAGLDRDRAMFGNAAVGQEFGQNLASQQARNAAVGQQFDQNLTAQQGQNAAMGQLFGINLQDAGFRNAAVGQRQGQAQNVFAAQEAERGRAVEERAMERNQPINEVSALLSGGQVQMPQFGAMPQFGTIPTTDYAGLVNANYQGQMNAYGQKQAMLGSLFGLGGDLGSAYIAR